MRKIKQTKWLAILTFVLLFMFSCSEENEFENTNPQQENFVELSFVKGIAKNIPFTSKDELSKKGTSEVLFTTKTIESIHESKLC